VLLALGVILSALGVGLIARTIDPGRFVRSLATLDWRWGIFALIGIGLAYAARAQRWAILLRPLVFRRVALWRALLTGQLLNLLLPIRIGEVVRSALVGREPTSSFARVLGSVLIEKAWDWLMLCVLIVIVAWAVPLPDWLRLPARSIGLVALIVLIGFILVALTPEDRITRGVAWLDRVLAHWPQHWHAFIVKNLRRLLDSLGALRQQQAIIGAASWTVIIWSLGVIINYVVLRAYGVNDWIAATALLVVLMIGVGLPPSIAGVGVYEGLTMLTLQFFGVPLETALAIGVTLHLIVAVPLIVGTAGLWLIMSQRGHAATKLVDL
jgi:glycosyltransferase 2 family protein